MNKELPLKLSDIEIQEILNYSKNVSYVCKHESHEKIYKSAGLSFIKNSITPDLDVIDDLGNKNANLNLDNFVLKENIPTAIVEIIKKISLGFNTSKIRFSCLFKGITIPWHIDYNCENITRVHLPILTNDKCFYYYKNSNGKIIRDNLKFGKLYALDTNYEHCIKNNSEIDRVHFIVNVNTNFENYLKTINDEI
jgi:hypothetical protein